jgi:general secretion pathway protein K
VNSEKGAVLILVLAAIALLSVAVLEAARSVGVYETTVYTSAHELQTRYLARSGLGLVKAVLEEDDASVDSYLDDWGAVNSMGAVPVADVGWAAARIEDEEGKVDVNRLITSSGELDEFTYEQVASLLILAGLPEDRAYEAVDSMVDWIDEDSEVGGSGGEDPYYTSLDRPYQCADAPFKTVSELALVKGVGSVLLNQGEGDTPPLRSFLTVHGDPAGRININTARVETIMSLTPEGAPGVEQFISRDLAEDVVESRKEIEYQSTSQLKERFMEFDNDLFNQVQPHIDVKSSSFSVDVTGESEFASSRAHGVFSRKAEGSVELVYFRGF